MKVFSLSVLILLLSTPARAEEGLNTNNVEALGLLRAKDIQVTELQTVRGQPMKGREGTFRHSVQMKIRYDLDGCFNRAADVYYFAKMNGGVVTVSIAPQVFRNRRSLVAYCDSFPTHSVLLNLGDFEMTEKEALDLVFFAKYKFVNMEPAKVFP